MFKKIDVLYNGYINVRTQSGRRTKDKGVIELANWLIEKYLKPIEFSIKIWTHGRQCTGEIGNAEYLMDKLNLNWNKCQLADGLSGLIARSRRDGAMKLIKLLRDNPELLEYVKRGE